MIKSRWYTVEVVWLTADGYDSEYTYYIRAKTIFEARFKAFTRCRADQHLGPFDKLDIGEKLYIRSMYLGKLKNLMDDWHPRPER